MDRTGSSPQAGRGITQRLGAGSFTIANRPRLALGCIRVSTEPGGEEPEAATWRRAVRITRGVWQGGKEEEEAVEGGRGGGGKGRGRWEQGASFMAGVVGTRAALWRWHTNQGLIGRHITRVRQNERGQARDGTQRARRRSPPARRPRGTEPPRFLPRARRHLQEYGEGWSMMRRCGWQSSGASRSRRSSCWGILLQNGAKRRVARRRAPPPRTANRRPPALEEQTWGENALAARGGRNWWREGGRLPRIGIMWISR